jgi:CxxC motif-containing protein
MESKITCIICPIGCEVTIQHKDAKILLIEGHQCKKGLPYAEEELFDPKITLTTTMLVKGGELPLVSVKTSEPMPKDMMFDVMDCISLTMVDAPVEIGDVLIKNVLDLNANIVATKRVKKLKIY